MKKKILLLSTLLMVFFAGILLAQPIAHWPLDDNANDIIGGKNGTVVGGVQFLNDAERGDVAYLDGVDGIIELPSVLYEDTTIASTTIGCWFNWEGGANWQRVYSLGLPGGLWRMLYFCPKDGWDLPGFHVTAHDGLTDSWYDYAYDWGSFTDFDTITPGEWYHSAVVLGDAGIQIYMNGVKIVDADSVDISPANIQEADSSYNVIGASHWADDDTYMGMIDDFAIWDYALSDAQIAGLAAGNPVGIKDIINNSMTLNFYGSNGRILYTAINDESEISNVTVYSLSGKVLFSSNRISDLTTRQFDTGIYLVSAILSDKRIVNKVALFK